MLLRHLFDLGPVALVRRDGADQDILVLVSVFALLLADDGDETDPVEVLVSVDLSGLDAVLAFVARQDAARALQYGAKTAEADAYRLLLTVRLTLYGEKSPELPASERTVDDSEFTVHHQAFAALAALEPTSVPGPTRTHCQMDGTSRTLGNETRNLLLFSGGEIECHGNFPFRLLAWGM